MKKILINGCSYGKSWGGQRLATDLKLDLVNLSTPGGSNARIVRTTIDYLLEHDDVEKVVIILTFLDRDELRYNDTYYNYSLSSVTNKPIEWYRKASLEGLLPEHTKYILDRYRYDFDNEQSVVNHLGTVLTLSSWLKSKKIKHVIFSAPGECIYPGEKRKSILKLEKACQQVPEIIDVRWSSNQFLGDSGMLGNESDQHLPKHIRHYASDEHHSL
ncbi:uncharacterized protein METZ01_LOCUS139288, partial [marine metagenome]